MAQNKIQFNSVSGKTFRTKIAKYYVAMHELADFLLTVGKSLQSAQSRLATDKEDLLKLAAGEKGVLRDADTINESLRNAKAEVEIYSKARDAAKAKADKAKAEALATIPDGLYKAFIANDGTFNAEFAKYLVAMGFDTATADNVPELRFGRKENSSKDKCKTGQLMGDIKETPWNTLFMNTLCDELLAQKVFDPYKYEYQLPVKKSDKK